MTKEPRPPAVSPEDLAQRWIGIFTQADLVNLPEFETRRDADPKIVKWLADQEARILAAIRDCDEILFEQATGAWQKANNRVNELVAEEYRKQHSDPEIWELRYVKWMVRVQYIAVTCPKGDFLIYPRRPAKRPSLPNWYTVDEVIDMLHPTTVAAIQLSDRLPIRPESLGKPKPGEKHLHVHIEDKQVSLRFDCGEVPYAGEGVR